jgi:hypothetical protein
LMEPGVRYIVAFHHKNLWSVNPLEPCITNATTSKDPCLSCRLTFTVPRGYRVSLINKDIIESDIIDDVYDVRLPRPLLAEQKIEYILAQSK